LFTSAGSFYAFGEVLTDPLHIIERFDSPVVVFVGALCILASTLSLNAATNAVSVGFDFTGLLPRLLTFKRSIKYGLVIGILSVPWLWYGQSEAMNAIFGVFGCMMGPLLAIMLIDFFLVRRRYVNLEALATGTGPYAFRNGFHIEALVALVVGFLGAITGLVIPGLPFLYNFNWFIGFSVGGLIYLALTRGRRDRTTSEALETVSASD
jgi:NCS1 family nucleobase:cation symporter-1